MRSLRLLLCLVPAVALAPLAGACGGAAPSELFAHTDGGGVSADSGTPGTFDSSTTMPVKDSGTSTFPDVTVLDTGTNEPDTAVPPVDTGPPPAGNLTCGVGLTCDANQYCCATSDPTFQNPTTYACMDGPSTDDCSGDGGTPITCDSDTNCTTSAGICCGTEKNDQYTHLECAATCDTAEDHHFCDPTVTPDQCASQGQMCTDMSQILPGFFVCQ
jgi:hypothetical protein